MREKLPESTWNEIRTALRLRTARIARNMGLPEGTVLARVKREHWTPEIKAAKAKARQPDVEQSGAITPMQSAAISMAPRAERYVGQMAGVAEKVVHVSAMQSGEILDRIEKVERFDRMARRTYGLDVEARQPALLNIVIEPGPHMKPAVVDLDQSVVVAATDVLQPSASVGRNWSYCSDCRSYTLTVC